MKFRFLWALWAASSAFAATVQSDCTPEELKTLQSPGIVAQFAKGTVLAQDCTPIKLTADRELLLVVHVFNAPGGYESYFSVFSRAGLSDKTVAQFKSGLLGFDVFPLLYNKVNRLLFVYPSSDKSKVALYMNVQSGPAASRFSRWELNMEPFSFAEAGNRYWILEAGILPKVYEDRGIFRALIESRSVEI